MTDATIGAPAKPMTVAELSEQLERARRNLALKRDMAAQADAALKRAIAEEKSAYSAFNEGVAAMRPKRPRAAKKEGAKP